LELKRAFNKKMKDMKRKSIYYFFITAVLVCSISSCKKDWLDAKSNKALIVPATIADADGMLDNSGIMNANQPVLGEVSADNYYVTLANWQNLPATNSIIDQNAYIWAADLYQGQPTTDWSAPYQKIFYANVALEAVNKVSPDASNEASWNRVKGEALFWRAFNHYSLAQEFCKGYDSSTASTDLGIPLKLTADINDPVIRSTVAQTYQQILKDVMEANRLLPTTAAYKTRPALAASYALTARIYLAMRAYQQAGIYADSSLQVYSTLLDYNSIDSTAPYPFAQFNDEDEFFVSMPFSRILFSLQNLIVDSTLYSSYDINDMRRALFFVDKPFGTSFRGSYRGSFVLYGGIATDEIYLIRAEAFARAGNISAAMGDLNTLLETRWRTGLFTPFTATSSTDALNQILTERRKELIFRGLRWTDLRRLNLESGYETTLTRDLSGQIYTLAPNADKYVLPVPDNEIQTSHIQQNPR
jgi:hypothetical protein